MSNFWTFIETSWLWLVTCWFCLILGDFQWSCKPLSRASPFPAHLENFLAQRQAVFRWSRSQLLKLSLGHGINMIIVKSRSKRIFIAWLRIMSSTIRILSLGSILCHMWKLMDSNRSLDLFSKILQLIMQHFLESPVVAKWFDVDPGCIEHQIQPAPGFLAYNRNGRVTEWQSRQVFPICRPNDFDVKNPPKSDGFEVEAPEVRCQMLHRLIHLPRCQLVSLDVHKVFIWKVRKRRVEIQKRVFRGHFPRLIGNAQFLAAKDPTAVWVLCFTQYFDCCSSRCCFVVLLLKLFRMPP